MDLVNETFVCYALCHKYVSNILAKLFLHTYIKPAHSIIILIILIVSAVLVWKKRKSHRKPGVNEVCTDVHGEATTGCRSISRQASNQYTSQAHPYYVNPPKISGKLNPEFELKEFDQKSDPVYESMDKYTSRD